MERSSFWFSIYLTEICSKNPFHIFNPQSLIGWTFKVSENVRYSGKSVVNGPTALVLP